MANKILATSLIMGAALKRAEDLGLGCTRIFLEPNLLHDRKRLYVGKDYTSLTSELLTLSLDEFITRIIDPMLKRQIVPDDGQSQGDSLLIKQADRLRDDSLLVERGATHGDFERMSGTIQEIKFIMRRSHNWGRLHSGQKEALELIATKIGRILTGDPGHKDHWADGAGYFTKGLEACAAYSQSTKKHEE